MTEQKIYYKKARDFGAVFGASFGYIRQNFRSFYGSLLIFTVPFIALCVTIIGYLVSEGFSGFASMVDELWLVIFAVFIIAMIMQTVYVTVINEHLIANEETAELRTIKSHVIGKRFFGSFWRVLGNLMLLGIIGFVFFLIYSLVNSLIAAAFSALGIGGILIAGLLQLVTSLMITPIIGYFFVSCIFVVQRDKVSVITAIGKVFRYLKGNFWITWAISVIGYITSYIASFIAAIPIIIFIVLQVIARIKVDTGSPLDSTISPTAIIVGSIIFVVSIALMLCAYSIYFLLCVFQYTSLEEKKEGASIVDKINQIQ